MNLRYALPLFGALIVGSASEVSAQLIITSSNYIPPTGSVEYRVHTTGGEEDPSANDEAIEALIARAGAAQTWDFSSISFTEDHFGEVVISSGAVGPMAEDPLFATATVTMRLPTSEIFFDDEGEPSTITGEGYFYLRLTPDAAFALGAHTEAEIQSGEEEPVPITMILKNLPSGEQQAAFPMSFNTAWTSSYTSELDFSGFTFSNDVEASYLVDGWGTLIGPGVPAGVPALRVRVNEVRTSRFVIGDQVFETTEESTSYTFHTTTGVGASLEGGDFLSASFSVMGTTTSAEPGTSPVALALEAPHPNPSSGSATFALVVPEASHVRVAVYDILGREVASLADEVRPAGRHVLAFDGAGLAPGVYVIRATNGVRSVSRQLTVLR